MTNHHSEPSSSFSLMWHLSKTATHYSSQIVVQGVSIMNLSMWILYCVSISEHDVSRASLETYGHFARDFGISTNNQSHTPTIYKQHTSNFILCLMMAITAKNTKWRFLLYNGYQSITIRGSTKPFTISLQSCRTVFQVSQHQSIIAVASWRLTVSVDFIYNLTTLK